MVTPFSWQHKFDDSKRTDVDGGTDYKTASEISSRQMRK
jgi:hypothetical protein